VTAVLEFVAAASDAGRYLEWGVVSISVANASIILAMIVVFALALVIPFRRRPGADGHPGSPS
jgi:hypothetical protein